MDNIIEYPDIQMEDVIENNEDENSSEEDPYEIFIRIYEDFLNHYVFYDPIHASMYFSSASYSYVYDCLISCVRKHQQNVHSIRNIENNDDDDVDDNKVDVLDADYFNVLRMFLPILSPIQINVNRNLVRYFKSMMALSGRELKKRNVTVPSCPTRK